MGVPEGEVIEGVEGIEVGEVTQETHYRPPPTTSPSSTTSANFPARI